MNTSEKTIYWHIGFPKTATTSLQKFVFPSIKEINYLGWNYLEDSAEKKRRNEFVSQIRDITTWHSKGVQFEQPPAINKLLKKHFPLSLQNSKNLLVSDESVISKALVPQKRARLLKFVSPLESIGRLIALSESSKLRPKFILVLRRQEDLLESIYAQAAPELGERLGVKSLDEYVDAIFDTYKNDEPINALRYSDLVANIETLVDQDQLLVLPYEMLNLDFDAFRSRLGLFLGLNDLRELNQLETRKINVKSSSRGKLVNQAQLSTTIKKAMFGNVSFGGLGKRLKCLDFIQTKHVSLSEYQVKFVRDEFRYQNKKLVDKFPDFKNLGY